MTNYAQWWIFLILLSPVFTIDISSIVTFSDAATPPDNTRTESDGVPPPVPDKSDTAPDTPNKASPEKRDISDQKTLEENYHQLIMITKKGGQWSEQERPTKGSAATTILNGVNTIQARKVTPVTTVRPVGSTQSSNNKKKATSEESYKEAYLPLYACDEITSPTVIIEDLYRGCTRGCQMKEPVQVTKLRLQSPKPYKEKLDVLHYSAVEMYDNCHMDILMGEHRLKSVVPYTLTDNEINAIHGDVKDLLQYNVELIHGSYPKAECSYWKDNQTKTIMTRVKLARYDMFWAPELSDYYIHIPAEQVNVLRWDSKYDGSSGQYRWGFVDTRDAPCLTKTDDEIVCLGSYQKGEDLHCATVGLLMEPPYVSSWDEGCHQKTVKDIRGAHFMVTSETTMSYREALKDKNPNVQSLSTAVTHLEELICTTGCSELTLMTIANNTDAIVDTPVGIWKRIAGLGNSATQCSAMDTGDVVLLSAACTIRGVVGIKHISSAGMTYHWDMSQLFATTIQHTCMTDPETSIQSLLQYQKNGTISVDTFAGRVELNPVTGDSRFLYYNEQIRINKKRWFPNVELEQPSVNDQTQNLEIAMMQQMRNLSAEYAESCKESAGPIILQNVGGVIWMIEQDAKTVWDNVCEYFWVFKIIIAIILGWIILYAIITVMGLLNMLFRFKKATHIKMDYKRPSSSGSTRL